jgi:hypothetical protein
MLARVTSHPDKTMTKTLLAAAALLAFSLPAGAAAVRADMEVDPTAYVLGGYSVHAGIVHERLRVDIGAFAMNVPQFLHGNSNFRESFDGYGLKLQYFPFADQAGAFAGVDVGLVRVRLRRVGTDLASQSDQIGVGVHAGYRFELGRSFYATPWLGVGYQFNAGATTLGGQTFTADRWSIFPAVHIGCRFD